MSILRETVRCVAARAATDTSAAVIHQSLFRVVQASTAEHWSDALADTLDPARNISLVGALVGGTTLRERHARERRVRGRARLERVSGASEASQQLLRRARRVHMFRDSGINTPEEPEFHK